MSHEHRISAGRRPASHPLRGEAAMAIDERLVQVIRLQVLQQAIEALRDVVLYERCDGCSKTLNPAEAKARCIEAVAGLVNGPATDAWQRSWEALQLQAVSAGLTAEDVLTAWAVGLEAWRDVMHDERSS